MSVSMPETAVFTSSTPGPAQGNANANVNVNARAEEQAGRSAPAVNGGNTASVSFHSAGAQGGPVFGHQQASTDLHDHAAHHPHDMPMAPSFLHQLKHLLAHLFGGHRPHRPQFGNPYPAAPGRPDPQYAAKSSAELSKQLRDNFNAFQDPKKPGLISATSIFAMANRGESANPSINENTRLANELLRRPDLMKAFDRTGTNGTLDGLISRHDLNSVINSNNPFTYTTDKQLAGEMLTHFNALKGGSPGQELTSQDLRRMAARSLTGNPAQDHLTQLAQEALKRGDVLRAMDNLKSRDNDGRIYRDALFKLAR